MRLPGIAGEIYKDGRGWVDPVMVISPGGGGLPVAVRAKPLASDKAVKQIVTAQPKPVATLPPEVGYQVTSYEKPVPPEIDARMPEIPPARALTQSAAYSVGSASAAGAGLNLPTMTAQQPVTAGGGFQVAPELIMLAGVMVMVLGGGF